jgi:hypothetical protein
MKNLTDLTPDQLYDSKVLIDQMCQLVFRRDCTQVPMTKELNSIINFINDIDEIYFDRQTEIENNQTTK